MALADDADRPVQAADQSRHGRLAGAGVAGEHDVVAGVHLRQAGGAPLRVEALDGDEAPNGGLHLGQPDEAVELGQHRFGGVATGGRRGRERPGAGLRGGRRLRDGLRDALEQLRAELLGDPTPVGRPSIARRGSPRLPARPSAAPWPCPPAPSGP